LFQVFSLLIWFRDSILNPMVGCRNKSMTFSTSIGDAQDGLKSVGVRHIADIQIRYSWGRERPEVGVRIKGQVYLGNCIILFPA